MLGSSDDRHERKSVLVYFYTTLQRGSEIFILVVYGGCFFFVFDQLEYKISPQLPCDESLRAKALFPLDEYPRAGIISMCFTRASVLRKHLWREF